MWLGLALFLALIEYITIARVLGKTYNEAPNNAYLGWGVYVTNRVEGDAKKRKSCIAAAHIGGKDISLWTSAYPSGFQPYRNSHFNYDEWEAAGYDRAFVEDYLVQILIPIIIQIH